MIFEKTNVLFARHDHYRIWRFIAMFIIVMRIINSFQLLLEQIAETCNKSTITNDKQIRSSLLVRMVNISISLVLWKHFGLYS